MKGRYDFRNQLFWSFNNIFWLPFAFLELFIKYVFFTASSLQFLKWVLVCKGLSTLSIPFMRKRRTANKLCCKIHMLNVSWILKENIVYKQIFSWNNLEHHVIYKLDSWAIREPNQIFFYRFWNWVCWHIEIYTMAITIIIVGCYQT